MTEVEKEIADLKTRLQITEHRAQVNFDESAVAESKVRELEKENSELKAQNEKQSNLIQGLFATNKKANEQIEKMKCCAICKHKRYDYNFGDYECMLDYATVHIEEHCDKWELAE